MGRHELKRILRRAYARVLFHSGLHALVDRWMPRRLTILFGHCVADEACNGFLPPDMKIRGERLEELLGWFGRRYELCTIGGGLERLRAGGKGRSLVALSMDDGYRDNKTALLPLLERTGARATVFLESRPLDERRVNWSHKFFWLLAGGTACDLLARRYRERCEDGEALEKLRVLGEEGGSVYHVKRLLKYDADQADRDRVIDALFREAGGDERALCDALYLSWDDARALRDAGVELGGHTVRHEILSRLDAERQAQEIDGCAAAMERELGSRGGVFAYPFGRRWDYDEESIGAARKAGFEAAVNTHAGTNDGRRELFELRRLPIDDGAELPLLVAEACGGFDLLRRFGLDLSE